MFKHLTALVAGVGGLAAASVGAHEIENTHVLITFLPEGQYQIDILNDADWMWRQLTGSQNPLPAMAERDRRVVDLTQRSADAVTIAFNGEPVAMSNVEYIPPVTSHPLEADGWPNPVS